MLFIIASVWVLLCGNGARRQKQLRTDVPLYSENSAQHVQLNNVLLHPIPIRFHSYSIQKLDVITNQLYRDPTMARKSSLKEETLPGTRL